MIHYFVFLKLCIVTFLPTLNVPVLRSNRRSNGLKNYNYPKKFTKNIIRCYIRVTIFRKSINEIPAPLSPIVAKKIKDTSYF